MSEPEHIPEPDDSGSNGSQVEGDIAPTLVEAQPRVNFPMARAIEGLAASNSRVFGAEATSVLIAGVTAQLATELDSTKQAVSRLHEKIERMQNDLSKSETRKAVLEERIRTFRSTRHIKNLIIAVGSSLLIGVSQQLFQNNQESYGYLSIALGCVLIGFGWASAPTKGVE